MPNAHEPGAHRSGADHELRAPRYLDACVTGVLPTLLRAVGGGAGSRDAPADMAPEGNGADATPDTTRRPTTPDTTGRPTTPETTDDRTMPAMQRLADLLGGASGVVLLVLDGLGAQLLRDHGEVAPTLASAPGTTVDACFPTTTSTNLTSIGTGRAPSVHGITGTAIPVPGHDRLLVSLSWLWDHQFDGDDARPLVAPEIFQPSPPVFAAARARGLDATTVLRPEFAESGLTRAALRGGTVVAATDLPTTLAAAVAAAAPSDGRHAIVYAHHGDIDAAGHLAGPGSEFWVEQLVAADSAIAAAVRRLPAGIAVVVTADHGMVQVPPDGFVELADAPELLDGVQLTGGDPRARQLTVEPGAASDVRAAWEAHIGDAGMVVLRDEAIAAGWFGPTTPDDDVRARIGDVLAIARHDIAWIHRDRDPFGGRLPGQHGSLTSAELEVPVIVLKRDDA